MLYLRVSGQICIERQQKSGVRTGKSWRFVVGRPAYQLFQCITYRKMTGFLPTHRSFAVARTKYVRQCATDRHLILPAVILVLDAVRLLQMPKNRNHWISLYEVFDSVYKTIQTLR